MRIRGERECKNCGHRWSYYETGSVSCPECQSLQSVGVDERTQHTANPVEFDLSAVRELVDAEPLHRVADEAKEVAREYVRKRGFVRGGDLLALDDQYLAAAELSQVADLFGRSFSPSDDEEIYFTDLLTRADDADAERLPAAEVPQSMRAARGLAYAEAVRDYRRELRDWEGWSADEEPEAEDCLSLLREHGTRIRMLEGDVPPETAERLVAVVRDVATYLRAGDAAALDAAGGRLDALAEDADAMG